jgi:hypothetical protein
MNVFVIMPFDSDFDAVYQNLIKEPLVEKGHSVGRADDMSSHQNQNILKTIIQGISNADIVIADLTTQNPNVYYELGIAHALNKRTIQIVQDLDEIPFDLRSYSVVIYSTMFNEAKKLTIQIIDYLHNNKYIFSNPVSDFTSISIENPSILNYNDDDDMTIEESDSELGSLDLIANAEEGIVEIGKIVGFFAEGFQDFTMKTNANTAKANTLNQNPHQKGSLKKRQLLAKEVAKDLSHLASSFEKQISNMDSAWNSIERGLEHFLTTSDINSEDDMKSAHFFHENMMSLKDGVKGAITMIEDVQTTFINNLGLSRDLNRSLRQTDKSFNKILDQFRLGDSILARILELTEDMISRYSDSDNSGESE